MQLGVYQDPAGVGSGFLSQWASSSDAGATWAGSSASPFQMDVVNTANPGVI